MPSTHKCPGCGRTFDDSRSLSTHKRYCKKVVGAASDVLKRRRHNIEVQEAAKVQRREEEEEVQRRREEIRESTAEAEDELPQPASPSPPPLRPSGRPARRARLPKRFRDEQPPLVAVILPQPPNDLQVEPAADAERASTPDAEDSTIRTDPNHYGIYRTYHGNLPTHNPDDLVSLASISDSPTFGRQHEQIGARPWWSGFGSSMQAVKDNYFAPFLNITTFLLMCWFYSGSNMKSLAELDRLINEVILVKEFDRADLQGFRAAKEVERLDRYHGDPEDIRSSFSTSDGWQETSVKIRVPADGVMHESLEHAPEFSIPGLFYRRPLEVIKNAFREKSAEHFHFTPFEQHYHSSPDAPPERIYSEIYTSPAMLEEHDHIRSQPRENGCTLETVVAAIMLWSDSTHLASFGTASLWPIYLFLGNQSKYIRGKTSAFAAHHIAYIPKVRRRNSDHTFSDSFTSFLTRYKTFIVILSVKLLQPKFLRTVVMSSCRLSGCFLWMTTSSMPMNLAL